MKQVRTVKSPKNEVAQREKKGRKRTSKFALGVKVKCSECGQLKFKKYTNKVYVDLSGRRWNGKNCPTCHYVKSNLNRKPKTSSPRVNKVTTKAGFVFETEHNPLPRGWKDSQLVKINRDLIVDKNTKIRHCSKCDEKTANYRICNSCLKKDKVVLYAYATELEF